jgi:LEA14-like dessication related protein
MFMKYIFCAALLLFIFSCKKPQSFEYREMRDFKVDSIGFEHSNISMNLVYFNPNNFGVSLKKVDCDIYVEHNYVGHFNLDTLMHITKRSEFALPAKMRVNMKNLFKNALTTVFASDFLVEAKGTVKAGRGGIYITVPFNYSARQKMKLF